MVTHVLVHDLGDDDDDDQSLHDSGYVEAFRCTVTVACHDGCTPGNGCCGMVTVLEALDGRPLFCHSESVVAGVA